MAKKILKIVGITFAVLLIVAFTIPYLFKDQIKAKITQAINENVDAKVGFSEADLSLFKNFPKATISVKQLTIINKAPFEGDTLVALDELHLKMSVMELFKGDKEPMSIEGISTKNGLINIIFNKEGVGNFDIALKNKDQKQEGKSHPLTLKIKGYDIENLKFKFTDEASKMKMVLDSINHSGTGDFTNNLLDLDTKTTAKVSLSMDKMNYMNHVAVSLDAILGIDLNQSKYTFKENKAKINDLPLEFNGFMQMADAGQVFDLTFKTPTASFKNFLGLIPAAYRGPIENVQTSGDFTVNGFAKGVKSETSIPKFSIAIASNNASFKYPNLPKSIKNIIIDTKIVNETGVLNDTYVNLDHLSFSIDQDVFSAKANIKNVATNALVDAALKGTLNLGNLSQAYPIKLAKPLSGILKADVTTKFDMASVEKSDYQNINNAGTIIVTGFKYVDDHGKSMTINAAKVAFNPSRVNLQEFKATTGKSDLNVTGVLDNFYGYVFRNQNLQGNFNVISNQLAVSDFMSASDAGKNTNKSNATAMKIPAFLDCSLTAKANTVYYDNLTLKNCSGKLSIKDQAVTLENVKTSIFDGQIGLNGTVSTKEKTPKFNMNLGLNKVDINQTFTQLDLFKKVAPIAGVINGKINSTVALSGTLNENTMTPNVNTLTGDLLGEILGSSVNPANSNMLHALGDNIKFIDLKKLNFNDVKAALSFKDGKVSVKPFDLKYQDIKVTVAGTHGFDQLMNYTLKFDVPAKYLGNDANALLTKLSPSDFSNLKNIPITALLTGSFSKPKVATDMKAATTALVTQLAQKQKEKLLNKGANALQDLLNKNTKGDTTKTKNAVNQAKDLLNGLFGKKKTP
ncbi:AsmA-like C-terminal region-containing protein [Flavobacterium aciduliphilum]|uniref:AsmA-like protein n=1 Tax=Flavobacterium aciduliphilum TaxID=1101402 RepID=A0A328YNY9_9FLAO|nr:AsmA-like C-terminal region-containing protein [Flavobacterium aciduliphilum]RAR71806.1 AsmA-like protein [Flavobacterium aciduliphilum]